MKTVIQEHAFDDPRFKASAKYLRQHKIYIDEVMFLYTIHHAAVRVWRHSQQHGVVNATGAQIDEWADIERVHLAFAAGRLITLIAKGEDSFSSLYRIHGNEDSIEKLNGIRGTRSEIGKRGAQARWGKQKQQSNNNSENGNQEVGVGKCATRNGKRMAIAIDNMAIAIDPMANCHETVANCHENMANKDSKRVSKDRICNSYLPNFSDAPILSPTNFPKNDLHNNVADTPPNHAPNDLAVVPRGRLTAKARGPARDRAIVVSKEMNDFWEEYVRGINFYYDANPKPNQHTFGLIQRVCKLLGDEAIGTLRIYLQEKHPGFCKAKHSLPVFEKHLTALNVQTQKVIAWENGEAPHPDDLDSIARQKYAQKLRKGQV